MMMIVIVTSGDNRETIEMSSLTKKKLRRAKKVMANVKSSLRGDDGYHLSQL